MSSYVITWSCLTCNDSNILVLFSRNIVSTRIHIPWIIYPVDVSHDNPQDMNLLSLKLSDALALLNLGIVEIRHN